MMWLFWSLVVMLHVRKYHPNEVMFKNFKKTKNGKDRCCYNVVVLIVTANCVNKTDAQLS